jgi:glyceraldehyde 3-phosphate dehydrogenase
VGKVLPELKGRLDGIASRVPVPDGSVVDLFAELGREVTPAEVNAAMRSAAEGALAGILQYTEAPVVSSDIIGNPHSSIFDATFTSVRGGRFLKCLSWYDNEWGYSQRVCDLLGRLRALG